ncbi:MAG: 23S rRNA (adenine(2503)-C(2))-methyltransferase RlmN [Actinobacteria bacterium]|nr:23S rRNA (adenine(2503)-C(2))-methyltransferase RlmN [Actinomycetota bacterium]
MDFKKIENLLAGEPHYRYVQAQKAIYIDMADSWQNVTALPQKIRDMLENEAPVKFDFETVTSVDRTTLKALLKMGDGLIVETVLLKHKTRAGIRNTVCVSSQAGCPMGCVFCRTAKAGYARNLNPYEITGQVLFFKYFLKKNGLSISNVVFMGMGEPFLNYSNVINSIRILNDREKFGIGARKISVSTCGIPAEIAKLASEKLQVNLAVSLNASSDKLRSRLMPVNNKYPLNMLMDSVRKYIEITNRRVMFEYIMMEGINDSVQHAEELSQLLSGVLCFINLIPFNGSGQLRAPSKEVIKKFMAVLDKNKIAVTQRHSFGQDISAACGQLVYSDKK